MKLISIVYAAMCVLVPIAWGLIVYWSTLFIEKRLKRRNGTSDTADDHEYLSVDYHI